MSRLVQRLRLRSHGNRSGLRIFIAGRKGKRVPFFIELSRDAKQDVREEAALALGASRVPGALSPLTTLFSDRHLLLDHEILLRAISIARHEDAVPSLLNVVRTRRPREALTALEPHDPSRLP